MLNLLSRSSKCTEATVPYVVKQTKVQYFYIRLLYGTSMQSVRIGCCSIGEKFAGTEGRKFFLSYSTVELYYLGTVL